MDELDRLFNSIVNRSIICDLNPGVVVIKNKTEIEVFIDHVIANSRKNARSSRLRFLYSREFLEDHFNIRVDTPVDEIIRIINMFDFNAITHSANSQRCVFTYVIQTNGAIVAQTS